MHYLQRRPSAPAQLDSLFGMAMILSAQNKRQQAKKSKPSDSGPPYGAKGHPTRADAKLRQF